MRRCLCVDFLKVVLSRFADFSTYFCRLRAFVLALCFAPFFVRNLLCFFCDSPVVFFVEEDGFFLSSLTLQILKITL